MLDFLNVSFFWALPMHIWFSVMEIFLALRRKRLPNKNQNWKMCQKSQIWMMNKKKMIMHLKIRYCLFLYALYSSTKYMCILLISSKILLISRNFCWNKSDLFIESRDCFHPWKRTWEASIYNRADGKSKPGSKSVDHAGRGNIIILKIYC